MRCLRRGGFQILPQEQAFPLSSPFSDSNSQSITNACGLLVDWMQEIPSHKVQEKGMEAKAENRANQEIPLFLALRARKLASSD